MTPGFKPFTAIVQYSCKLKSHLISKLENVSRKFQCRFFIVMITGTYLYFCLKMSYLKIMEYMGE